MKRVVGCMERACKWYGNVRMMVVRYRRGNVRSSVISVRMIRGGGRFGEGGRGGGEDWGGRGRGEKGRGVGE